MDGRRTSSPAEPPIPKSSEKREQPHVPFRRSSNALLLQPLPFMENILLLIMEKHRQRKSSPGAFFAGISLRVCGVRKLLLNHYDQWQQPWAVAASKVYYCFLHIHTVFLQYYTLTYIKYRMFLKLLGRGAKVLTIHLWNFFFFQQAAKSRIKLAAVKVTWEICHHLWITSYVQVENTLEQGKGTDASS